MDLFTFSLRRKIKFNSVTKKNAFLKYTTLVNLDRNTNSRVWQYVHVSEHLNNSWGLNLEEIASLYVSCCYHFCLNFVAM